jgi:hypothetical protein
MRIKDSHAQNIKKHEEAIIKSSCEAYYLDKEQYLTSLLLKGTYRDSKQDDRLAHWYLEVAEVKMNAVGLPDLDSIKALLKKARSKSKSRSRSRSTTPNKKPSPNVSKNDATPSQDNSNDTSKTEILNKSITPGKDAIKEEKKDPKKESKEDKEKLEKLNKKIKKEKELVINMMNYLRDADVTTNNGADIYRFWKDCKEKAKNGLIWHKSDSNAELVFLRYFKIESTLRRL